MPFAEESLEEIVTPKLQFHGPQTLGELGVSPAPQKIHSIIVHGRFVRAGRVGLFRLLPNLAIKTLCFLQVQSAELGLRVGRDITLSGKASGVSLTRILNTMLHGWSEALAVVRLHYINKAYITSVPELYDSRAELFRLMQRTGYIVRDGRGRDASRWTSNGFYALARVHENQRQKEQVAKFNGFKEVFLQRGRQWGFAEVAGKLGWSNGYAQNYAALAREAGQPLKVYVIGSEWQRLFGFGVQELSTERRSNAVAGLAYKLLRAEIDCGVDDVLDRLCDVATMVGSHNRKGVFTYGCTPPKLSADEKFLKSEGLIESSKHGNQITIKVIYAGRKLYQALGQAGRLGETGHYIHI